jgi:hypothetical protein
MSKIHSRYLNLSAGIKLVTVHPKYQTTVIKYAFFAHVRSLGLGGNSIC